MIAKGLLGAYVAIVVLVAVSMPRQNGGSASEEGRPMNVPMPWPTAVDLPVPAVPTTGIWTLAHDFVPAGALIRLEANGKWSYSTGMQSGPDGDLGAVLTAAQAFVPKAPVGALIAKIGGSTASIVDGTIYTVGSRAVIRVKTDVEGPLFLTINDHVTGLADNQGSITVKVSAYVPPAPPPSSEGKNGSTG